VTWLHRIEILNAVQLHVFQAQDAGQAYISAQQAALAHGNFRNDVQSGEFLHSVVLPEADIERRCPPQQLLKLVAITRAMRSAGLCAIPSS
jgi:hypothetical protein